MTGQIRITITRGCLLLMLFVGILKANALAQSNQGPVYSGGEIIVKFKQELNVQSGPTRTLTLGVNAIDEINRQGQLKEIKAMFARSPKRAGLRKATLPSGVSTTIPELAGIYRVRLSPEVDVSAFIRNLKNDPSVEFAEPNYIAQAAGTPNDPYLSTQWALRKTKADSAWSISIGDQAVVIAFLDTGLDTLHEDIAANLWSNQAEVPGNAIDDDGNGYADDVHGWSFVANSNDVSDNAGHGTHVAGIAGAIADNGKGIAGVSWHCKIMPVKVLNANGDGLYSDIAEGIVYAASQGANIINMSLGGYYPSQLLETALLNAYSSCLLVASAGNDSRSDLYYPAAYPYVLSVAGVDSNDALWGSSNYGSWVQIAAPAVEIMSTEPSDSYGELSGTSMAAGFVSGVSALLLSKDPTLNPASAFNHLLNTSDNIDALNPGLAGLVGRGRLNALSALSSSSNAEPVVLGVSISDPAPMGNGDGNLDATETANLFVRLNNAGKSVTGLSGTLVSSDAHVQVTQPFSTFGDFPARDNVVNQSGFTLVASPTTPNDHIVELQLALSATGGFADTLILRIRTKQEYTVGGLISTNTTWTREKMYVVTSNILVQSTASLTIEPGTTIRFNPGKYLRVDGSLMAVGTPTDSISFVANSPAPTPGFWAGLTYNGPAAVGDSSGNYLSGSQLRYVTVKHAATAYTGGSYVSDVSVTDCSGPAISGAPVVRDSRIQRCGGGVSTGFAERVTVEDCAGTGITSSRIRSSISRRNNVGAIISGVGECVDNLLVGNAGTGLTFESIWSANKGSLRILRNLCESNGGDGFNIVVWGDTLTSLEIQRNTVRNNAGKGIVMSAAAWTPAFTTMVSGNVVSCNGSWGVDAGQGVALEDNLIVFNVGGVLTTGSRIVSNSILYNNAGNGGTSLVISGSPESVHNNNLIGGGGYAFMNPGGGTISMTGNWWGTTSTAKIDSLIYDFFDDFNLGPVAYLPTLSQPDVSAPGYIIGITFNPPSPVGMQTVNGILQFSRPMDISVVPMLSIRDTSGHLYPVNMNSRWTDSTHFTASIKVNEMFLDGSYVVIASGAKDPTGIEVPRDTSQRLIVYTAGSASRELFAVSRDQQIRLSWHRSGILNLLGYNLYRSTKLSGPFSKINNVVINDTTYVDSSLSIPGTYTYVYTTLDGTFRESGYSGRASASVVAGLSPEDALPNAFALGQNFPNPFNPSTTIQYALPLRSHVALNVFNTLGQRVVELINGDIDAGYHEVQFDASNLASGTYFYRLQAGAFVDVKKLLLIR